MNTSEVKKNITRSLFAQLISLGVGFVLNFITPKFISEYSYAYWQTYTLYAFYVGVLHFGLLDGIVLRYSQYDYDQLDKPLLRSQFKVLLCITGFFSLLLCFYSLLFCNDEKAIIIVLVAFSIIVKNIYTYALYTFQITNQITKYSIIIITDRLLYGFFVLTIIISGYQEFYLFCTSDILAVLISIIVGIHLNQGLYLGKGVSLQLVIQETRQNILSGLKLMVANLSSMFLTSGSRLVIQWHWDTLVFGKVALAFSLSGLFLQFVNAASIALFPTLKRLQPEELPKLYKSIREKLSIVLFVFLLTFFPGCSILILWLPKYAISLKYISIILPMVIFTSKVNLLTNNYFKAYRKEKEMSIINCVIVAFGFLSYFFCAYVLDSLLAVLFCVVIVNMLCSIVSEFYLAKWIGIDLRREFIVELFMTIGFTVAAYFYGGIRGFLLYFALVIIYIWIYRGSVKKYFKRLLY